MEESYRERRENREKAMIGRDGRRWEGKTRLRRVEQRERSGRKDRRQRKGGGVLNFNFRI